MGWCSGTEYFDGAVDVAVSFSKSFANLNDEDFERRVLPQIVKSVYTQIEWDDWDCQDESKYAKILTNVRVDMGELERCPACFGTDVYDGRCYGELPDGSECNYGAC